MFDKNKFAQILNKINNTYETMTDFAKISTVNRTYLSQYINQKLDAPPSPKVLERIAKASHSVATYEELMKICGYINVYYPPANRMKNDIIHKYDNDLAKLNLSPKEKIGVNVLFDLIFSKESDDFNEDFNYLITNMIKGKERTQKLYQILSNIISEVTDEYEKKFIDSAQNSFPKFYMCPVYGRISAGQPNWAEENIEGRIPVPTTGEIDNPEECFYLKVNGESMNKVVKNGAYALIHKQDIVEDGEIAVVLVNGYDATLKKFSKQGDFIVLEPMSDVTDDPDIKTQTYDKSTSIKILGKYIGKFEMNG